MVEDRNNRSQEARCCPGKILVESKSKSVSYNYGRGGGTFTVQTFSLWRVWPRALPLDSGEGRNNLRPCAGRTRRGKWGGTGQCNAGELEAPPKLGTSASATFFCQHYGVGHFTVRHS